MTGGSFMFLVMVVSLILLGLSFLYYLGCFYLIVWFGKFLFWLFDWIFGD
jgi:hypothetical protein